MRAVGLRGRVILASVTVGLSAVLAVSVYVSTSLRAELVDQVAARLEQSARLVADRLGDPARESLPALAARLGAAADLRVTLIDGKGRVVGDSAVAVEKLGTLENHHSRPEVTDAMQGGTGRGERLSETVHFPMLYVAVRAPPGAPVRIARVAMSLERIEALVARERWLIVVGSGIALAIAVFASFLTARYSMRSLVDLTSVAQAMAAGDYQRRAHIDSRDEVGNLAATMNKLAEQLRATVGRLAAERDLLTAVLDSLQEGVLVVDGVGRILRVNPLLARAVGIGPEAAGRTVLEVSRLPELAEALERCLRGNAVVTNELVMRGREERTFLIVVSPLSTSGAVAVLHDVTAIRRIETVRRDFVSNVSHELRTPVSALRGAAETLLAGALDDPEQAHSFAAVIHRHSERLSRLVSDLLDLSRIESGEMKLRSEPVELGAVAAAAVEVVQGAAEEKGLTLELELGEVSALADPRAVEQVLVNLLDNAVKYTPAGGHVRLSAAEEDGFVRTAVSDTGPGISARHLPRIFERFYRADAGRSREVGGTGLGLAIVRHLVEGMGGEVRAESELGRGSVFSFTLPLRRA